VDRYRLLSSLGVGGAGQVVLVEDRLRPGSRLALKELLDATPEKSAELHREFATLATLRHPSLVEVLELEIDPATGRSQLIMEYVDGESVVDAIRREGAGSLLPVTAELLRALAFLHDFGLVHRDLKPGNILVRAVPKAGHRVVVLDFGLAAERRTDPNERADGMAGTLPYMAPELFDGAVPTKRTDLYAIGVVIFEAVHGKTPIVLKGNDINGFIAAAREGRRARPAPPPGLPAGLGRWLDEMLAPDAADRPSSATDALARLNEACDGNFALETTDDRAARLGSGQLVGRDQELAALREALTPSDRPRVVWLCGDAGSGKSRILRSLASEAIGSNGRVHSPPGLLPATADAFVDRVRADAAAAPTLVLLDEMERADNAVATFVDRIAREPREAPVRVVIAGRPGELTHPKLRKLLADTGVVPSLARVDLAPMGEAALKAMIDRASAGRSSAQARVRWLLENSEGNAGAAEALIVEGVWEKRGKIPVATALLQSIRRRLLALSPEARAWLEALAVLGDDTPESLVGELAGLEDLAGPARDEAVAAGLARHIAGSVSPDSRRAADAVISAASPERLRELHALAATHFATLERDTFGVISWRLARLWRGAGESERALAASLDSASAAEIAKQWEEAAARLRFALSLLARRDSRRAELWMRRAEALRQAMLHREAVKAFGWAARWATDPEKKLEARARRAKALFMAGEREAALKQAEDVLRTAEEARHSNAAARALEVIAMVRLQNFEPALSLAASRAALDHLGTQTTELRASVLHMFFMASSRLGHAGIDEAFLEARQIAVTLELHYQETMLLLAMAMHAELSRNFDREEALLLEASSVARDGASVLWFRWITYQIGRLNLLRGRYDRALESLRAAEELALYSGDASLAANFAEATVLALVHCGRAIEGAALARSWIDGGLLHKSEGQLTATRVTCAEALLATQDAPAASIRTMMDAVTTRLPKASVPIRLVAMANEIEFLHRVSPETDASTWVTAIDELRSDAKVPLNLFVSVRLDLTCADESLRRGRFADGAARASRVLETCSAECLPLAAAQASFVLAECLNGIGKSIEAGDAVNSGAALLNSAAERITDADLRRDFLDQKSVRTLSSRAPKPTEARRLEALYDMIRALNSETDPEGGWS
jgi:serine/threonine protein kinase